MDDDTMVEIPVSAAAAELLRDETRARAVGRLVSEWVLTPDQRIEGMMSLIADIKAKAHEAGLTDEMIDEELAAYNAERRS